MRLATEPTPPHAAALGIGGYRDLRARIVALTESRRPRAVVQLGLVAVTTALPLACAGVDEDPDSDAAGALTRRCDTLQQAAVIVHDAAEKTRDPARHAEAADDLLDRLGPALVAEAVAADQDLALAVRQLRHRLADDPLTHPGVDLLRGLGLVAREQLPER